jgi:hypothetical protein
MSGRRLGGALGEPPFRLLFAGQGLSAFGDWFRPVALAFAVLGLTGSAADLGLVYAAHTGGLLVFLLVGGVLADRIDPRRVMLGADVVRGVVQAVAAALLVTGSAELWQLVVLEGLYGVAEAFFNPASTAVVSGAVSAPHLQQANSLLGLSRSTTEIVAPALAGLLVAAAGPGWAIAADAASFGASAAFLALLRTPARERPRTESLRADLRSGWSAFRSRTWIWASVIHFSFFQMLGLAPFFVLGPFVARASLGGATAWATILSAAGLGSVLSGVVGLRYKPRRLLVATLLAMLLWAPQLVLLAFAAPVVAIAPAAFVGACGLSLANTFWQTALQQKVPRDHLARISAYDWIGSLALTPLGYALAGPVASALGVRTTLLLAAAWIAVATAGVASLRAVRALERGDSSEEAASLPGPTPLQETP